MKLTTEQKAELRRLAGEASPGPWRHYGEIDTQHAVEGGSALICNTLHGNDEANARFIAAANPAAVLALLAENERMHCAIDAAGHALSIGATGAAVAALLAGATEKES